MISLDLQLLTGEKIHLSNIVSSACQRSFCRFLKAYFCYGDLLCHYPFRDVVRDASLYTAPSDFAGHGESLLAYHLFSKSEHYLVS